MIIGVSGKYGVGKSTFSEIAVNEYGFKSMAFASLLKIDLINFMREHKFHFDPNNFYKTTVEKDRLVELPVDFMIEYPSINSFSNFLPTTHVACISYRNLMQWYGDTKRKENKDYFTQRFMDNCDFSEDIVIDDVRFTSEAALIHALGGFIVRINWPTRQNNSRHISETNLDNFPLFDVIITKEHNLALPEFQAICREQLRLLTGALDEPPFTQFKARIETNT